VVKLWSGVSGVLKTSNFSCKKAKKKFQKTEVFGTFMVEISGIEPLTS
jgi:hypothetical protein